MQFHVALVLLRDRSWMADPFTIKFDPITADFTYIRWLGNRKGIEEVTKTWDKTVVDRREDLTNWVELFRRFVITRPQDIRLREQPYSGNGPATVKLFWDLWNKKQ